MEPMSSYKPLELAEP